MKLKKIYHFEDHLFRRRTLDEINACLEVLGFDDEIVILLDTAFVDILDEKQGDKVGITRKGILVLLEFEFGEPSDYAKNKINSYLYYIRQKLPKIKERLKEIGVNIEIKDCIKKIMIIANSKDIKNEIVLNPNCEDERSKIETYYLYSLNARERLKTINDKLDDNNELDLKDYFFLENSMHTNHNGLKPHQVLIQVIETLMRTNLNLDQKKEYSIIFDEQCNRYVPKKHQPKVRRKINMYFGRNIDIIQMIKDQERNEERNEILEALVKVGASEELIENALNELENKSK